MAGKRKDRAASAKKGPEHLQQEQEVWQVGASQIKAVETIKDGPQSPWLLAVLNRTQEQILNYELLRDKPSAAQAWTKLLRAMSEPEVGAPHRPSEVEVSEATWVAVLERHLQGLAVATVKVDKIVALDHIVEHLSDQFNGPPQPALVDVPGMSPTAVASFFDAAAVFFEQRPWKKSGERPVRVECAKFSGGPWFAILMGSGGMTSGLVLYDDLEALVRVLEGGRSEEENARQTAALALTYGTEDETSPKDVEAAQEQGLRMAADDAFPVVYRMDPGLAMRPPLAWELELMEGCLRALPEFVRKKTRRLEPTSMSIPTAGGDLMLELSWAVG